MSKIKPGKLPASHNIPRQAPPVDPRLRFSFGHIDLYSDDEFSVDLCEDGYLEKMLCRLRDVCVLTVKEFRTNKSAAIRAHPITWAETKRLAGFKNLNAQLRGAEAWQFQITANEHGRIHGILIDDTFYVVWIDPTHALYG